MNASQSWTPWRSLLSPQPVGRSSAKRWMPVSLAFPRRESADTSLKVQAEPQHQNFVISQGQGLVGYAKEDRHCFLDLKDLCIFASIKILGCGLSGKWTTGQTGARQSLASSAWVQTWEDCRGACCVAWTERLSLGWPLTALLGKSCGNIWTSWEEVKLKKHKENSSKALYRQEDKNDVAMSVTKICYTVLPTEHPNKQNCWLKCKLCQSQLLCSAECMTKSDVGSGSFWWSSNICLHTCVGRHTGRRWKVRGSPQ